MTDVVREVVPYVFTWPYDARTSVSIAGTFNGWVPQPMTPQRDRRWEIRLLLPTAQSPHHYKFIVDGQWFWDVRLPTTKDSFGNVNNTLDLRRVLKEEAEFREDVRGCGQPAPRWMVRAAEGGRYRRCADDVAAAFDAACTTGNERSRVGPRLDALLRWRYVSGELLVDFSLADMKTGAVSTVRPVGAFPLRLPRPLYDCGYGLDDADDGDAEFELPTLALVTKRRDSAKKLVASG